MIESVILFQNEGGIKVNEVPVSKIVKIEIPPSKPNAFGEDSIESD
jgi:hypothetical protein